MVAQVGKEWKVVDMSEQKLIHHMETWLFHQAQREWNKSPEETYYLFKKYGLFDYVKNCYDYLHLSSYKCALGELETLLRNNGVIVNG